MFDLSIAIPTYQRLPLLRKHLSQLLQLICTEKLTERIQVCVSDNGSTDGTWEFLQERQLGYPFLKCFRQEINVRFARNFWTAGLMGDGNFLYFSGDDDEIAAGALHKLLHQSRSFSDKLLIMNSSLPGAIYSSREPSAGEVLELGGLDEYLDQCGLFFGTFIGNLLFHRDYFRNYEDYRKQVEQSAYPHFIPVVRAIRANGCIVLNDPVVIPDDSSRSWRKWQRIYTAVDMARLVTEEMAPYLEKSRTRRLLRQLSRSLPKACLYYWENEWTRLWRPGKQSFWCQSEPPSGNPYSNCSLRNIWNIYMKKC